jgi:hypothetical protein
MTATFLGWAPGQVPIRVQFDSTVSRLIDVGQLSAVVPKDAKIGSGWRAGWHPDPQTFYVFRDIYPGGERKTQLLHRFLNALEPGDGLDVHHRNGCGLDCSRDNMLVLPHAEHTALGWREGALKDWQTGLAAAHKALRARSRSGCYGVYTQKGRPGFFAQVTIPGQGQKYLGKFTDAKTAAYTVDTYLASFDPTDWRINGVTI